MKIPYKSFLLMAALFTSNAIASDQSQQDKLLEQRVHLLESALEPANAQSLVKMFAEAVHKRNGAVQYMLFCSKLQQQHLTDYQNMNWVSGTSSPSIDSYKIKQVSANQFAINFSMRLQGKMVGTITDKLEITQEISDVTHQRYCISTYSRHSSLNLN